MIINKVFEYKTLGDADIIKITSDIERCLSETGISNGSVIIFSTHSTCGVTVMEYEPGLIADFKKVWERLVPKDIPYKHNERWSDGNGYSHVRASILGFSATIPIVDGKMILGTWQQVVLVDFDNRPRERKVIFQFSGE